MANQKKKGAVEARRWPLSKVRNFGIMAHIDAGKTTTTERILYYTGRTHRMGEVHEGAAVTDWMDQERERGITITSASITTEWKKHRLSLIDTPGHVDFTAEVERSLRVLDGAVALFCAVGGVEPQSETVWHQADKYHVPRLCYINKMDRTGADFFRTYEMIKARFGHRSIPVQIPMGAGKMFNGLIDLIKMKAVWYHAASQGVKFEEGEIPSDLLEDAKNWREKMLESISDYDDELMELFLDGQGIAEDRIKAALRKATIDLKVTPVLCGSSYKNKGVQRLLDAIIDYLPSPEDRKQVFGTNPHNGKEEVRNQVDEEHFSGLAFKIMTDPFVGRLTYVRVYSGMMHSGQAVLNPRTGKKERIGRVLEMFANKREERQSVFAGGIVALVGMKDVRTGDTICDPSHPIVLESLSFPTPVITRAIEPKTKADQDHLLDSLLKLAEEDPTFIVKYDKESGQTHISGMGELHLDILVDRLLREFEVQANVGIPQVAYKEGVSELAKAEGRFVRQSGGRGQFGHAVIELEPLAANEESDNGLVFEDKIVGGSIPREYIPAVRKGVRQAMGSGVLAGYPLENIRVRLIDGSFHNVDSSEMAFQIAGSMALKAAVEKAKPFLAEPIMALEVLTPEEYVGDVMGDLSSRRAKVTGIDPRKDVQVVHAEAPLSNMFGYATSLRSMTQGRALFSMEFNRYQRAPIDVEEEVIKKVRGY
ncbi:MAG TPA: elongation factor G [Bacteroidetes bacterium]|nr:elongation factor G [bacterium BMS3Bbin04]HDO65022.1 elongation factor G [Bacteroidota bacterium]HEX04147.1 elongation factor G [Bacteroidota bacterium]